MILLGGILGRAKRKGWIVESPGDNAERVTIVNSDEFNVLTVEQVHSVVRSLPAALLAQEIVHLPIAAAKARL